MLRDSSSLPAPAAVARRGRRAVRAGPDTHQPRPRRAAGPAGVAACHPERGKPGRRVCRRLPGGPSVGTDACALSAAVHVQPRTARRRRRRVGALSAAQHGPCRRLPAGLCLLSAGPCAVPRAPRSSQVIQHGACLGLGIAALGTEDEEAFEDVKSVLYMDNAGGAVHSAQEPGSPPHPHPTPPRGGPPSADAGRPFVEGQAARPCAKAWEASPRAMRPVGGQEALCPVGEPLSSLPTSSFGLPLQWPARRRGSAWACFVPAAAPRRRQSCWRTHTRRRQARG